MDGLTEQDKNSEIDRLCHKDAWMIKEIEKLIKIVGNGRRKGGGHYD